MKKIITAILLAIVTVLCLTNVLAAPEGTVVNTTNLPFIPRVVIASYDIGADKVLGGDTFDLSYTLQNTGIVSIGNLLITMASDQNAYVPTVGTSNQIYIPLIEAGSSYTGKVSLVANRILASGTYNINFTMVYQDVNYTLYNQTALISIPMEQLQKLNINEITHPESCVLGSKVLINVSYKNPGKTDIKNLVMNLAGDILDKEKIVPIGTVPAGSSGYIDQYITPQVVGPMQIGILFTYEDSDGNSFASDPRSITITVKENSAISVTPSGETGDTTGNAQNGTSTTTIAGFTINSLWLVILIIGVVLVAAVVTFILVMARKRKKARKWDNKTK